MKFDLNELNPGTWFVFDPEKPDEGKICIRVLNSAKLAQIRSETIKTHVEYRGKDRHEYQTVDHSKRDSIIWDYCIVDWENLVDDEDNPIECTTENKIKLMNEHVGFASFVESCLVKLNTEAANYAEYLEKN